MDVCKIAGHKRKEGKVEGRVVAAWCSRCTANLPLNKELVGKYLARFGGPLIPVNWRSLSFRELIKFAKRTAREAPPKAQAA